MKKITLGVLAMLLMISMFSQKAFASLIGDTVNCALSNTTQSCNLSSAVVSVGGPEFTAFRTDLEIDIDDSSITLSPQQDNDFSNTGLLTLSDLNWTDTPGQITGFQLTLNNVPGFTSSDITFGTDQIVIDIANLELDVGSFAIINLEVAHTVVPVPAAVWLFGSGLLGLVGVARRKRANA